ncbi:MAG: tetratricopeptide repeat protein [Gammaproteobacteria bacterium]|nr:tetratricopeptide repeat protein [Gammaproteobacteria bacterium]
MPTIIRLLLLLSLLSLAACAGGPTKKSGAGRVIVHDINEDVNDDFERAVVMLNNKEYDKAITMLKSVVDREKRVPAPYVNLGMAYVFKGDNKQAEEYFHQALKLELGHPEANNELGQLYRKSGRFREARKAYRNALADNPDYLPVIRNLGILCEIYMHDMKCALEQFEEYLNYSPDDEKVKIWVTDLKQRLGR